MAQNNFRRLAYLMTIHPHEEATIKSFVVLDKRDRLLSLFGSSKRRKKACSMLNHFAAWDDRFTVQVETSEDVLAILRKAGAPTECHVISDSPELDGRDMLLNEAVRECEGFTFASVLCCVPGKLAFYFDEVAAPRNRVLLNKP